MEPTALEWTLLFDCYGEMLTEKQQTCFDLHYNQDLSLGEIAEELGISRQGVHDTLVRTEAALRSMEQRFEVASLLNDGMIYSDILEQTGASSATISRVNRSLSYGTGAYERVFARLKAEKAEEEAK